jgi:hypothetical protein
MSGANDELLFPNDRAPSSRAAVCPPVNGYAPRRNGEAQPIHQPIIPDRWIPRPISALSQEGTDTPWLLRGYLARKATTNFVGLWKIGKTTWLSRLLKAFDGSGDFCGVPVPLTSVLVVSEESERIWAQRRDDLGIGDHAQFITRPFLTRPDMRTWEQFVAHVGAKVKERSPGLVVWDTLPNLWPVRDENDAAGVLTALTPMNVLTEAGAGVLLTTHPAKTDAGEGRTTRGSGAIGGFVDVIVEMRRFDPERREDTRRVLTAYSRFDDTPGEVVLAFDHALGYSVVGTKMDVRADDRLAVGMDLLPTAPPGKTVEELLDQWPTDGPPKPGKRTLKDDLNGAVERKKVGRTGVGVRNNPHRYYAGGQDSIPASSPPYTPTLPESNCGGSDLVGAAVERFGNLVAETRPRQ